MKPRMIELYCGRGGWTKGFQAHGFECFGYDIDEKFRALYPGTFTQIDIRKLTVEELAKIGAKVMCASSPCEEFSRFTMPWTRAKNPPQPVLGVALAEKAFALAEALNLPLIFENVRTAQKWLGRSVNFCGPFHLWGNGIPALLPRDVQRRVKESYGSKQRDLRAEIPFELAEQIARYYA